MTTYEKIVIGFCMLGGVLSDACVDVSASNSHSQEPPPDTQSSSSRAQQ